MSTFLDAPAVSAWSNMISTGTYVLEHLGLKNLLDIHVSSATIAPLTATPSQFFVRRDRKDRANKVNVFGHDGTKLYTLERLSSLNPVWTMLTYPQRKEIATIHVGLLTRSVDFHNKPGLSHRDVNVEIGLAGRFRSFFLNDGAKYSWTRSKFLEKVINPQGGVEELRERIAKVKLMRRFKLDFEVLVDESKVDREVALATAYISMLTFWGIGESTNTVGPTFIDRTQEPIELVNEVPRIEELNDEEEEEEENDKSHDNEKHEESKDPQPTKVVFIIQNQDDSEVTVEDVSDSQPAN